MLVAVVPVLLLVPLHLRRRDRRGVGPGRRGRRYGRSTRYAGWTCGSATSCWPWSPSGCGKSTALWLIAG
ncbi:hypothetical protein HBB16_16135 [Pseudonocardia sp. MCCB 268]|nr:hypothetical protein [Pseudonocardia cytotoxica]